jgi:hypothetical protein
LVLLDTMCQLPPSVQANLLQAMVVTTLLPP